VSDAASPILVTGANGQLGRRLIQQLATQDPPRRVRALVRSQRAADSLADVAGPAQAEVRIVDYADATGLTEAARGAGAAVHLLGILKETRSNRYVDAHERPAEALAAAADAAGLRRVVLISILGSRPDATNPCLASKGRAEAILLGAKTPCSVIRVPMVLGAGDPASAALRRQAEAGTVSLVRGGATLEQPIAADDVVAGILAALTRTTDDDLVLDLAGPESLSHRALVERAAMLLGTTVRFRALPAFVAIAFAAIAERLLAEPPVTRAMLGVLEHDDAIDPAPAAEALGITLTDLDETLRRAFEIASN
jgi:NADH dehydrogenase